MLSETVPTGIKVGMPRKRKEPTEPVRIGKSVARKARTIASALDMSLPDYLTERLEKLTEEEFESAMAKIRKRPAETPPERKKKH
jgi:hypothetical protein